MLRPDNILKHESLDFIPFHLFKIHLRRSFAICRPIDDSSFDIITLKVSFSRIVIYVLLK